MIRMTQEINEKYLNWDHSGGRKADQVNCMLCIVETKITCWKYQKNMLLMKNKR